MTDRRKFLTGVVAAGAVTAVKPTLAQDAAAGGQSAAPHVPSALPPNAQVAAAEAHRVGLIDANSNQAESLMSSRRSRPKAT